MKQELEIARQKAYPIKNQNGKQATLLTLQPEQALYPRSISIHG